MDQRHLQLLPLCRHKKSAPGRIPTHLLAENGPKRPKIAQFYADTMVGGAFGPFSDFDVVTSPISPTPCLQIPHKKCTSNHAIYLTFSQDSPNDRRYRPNFMPLWSVSAGRRSGFGSTWCRVREGWFSSMIICMPAKCEYGSWNPNNSRNLLHDVGGIRTKSENYEKKRRNLC